MNDNQEAVEEPPVYLNGNFKQLHRLKKSDVPNSHEVFYIFDDASHPFTLQYPMEIKIFNCKYASCQHYFLYNYLKHTGQEELAHQVSNLRDSRSVNRIAAQCDFTNNENDWHHLASRWLIETSFAKFRNSIYARERLFQTIGCTILFEDNNSKYLGVEIPEDTGDTLNPESIQGKNVVGECLMAVREYLLKDAEYAQEKINAMQDSFALDIIPNIFDHAEMRTGRAYNRDRDRQQ